MHSLTKWIGLLPKNLKKHELRRYSNDIGKYKFSDFASAKNFRVFRVDSSTCSLCNKYYDRSAPYHDECHACPLAIVRGDISCTQLRSEEAITPYQYFTEKGDPKLMIHWLRKAVEYEKIIEESNLKEIL